MIHKQDAKIEQHDFIQVNTCSTILYKNENTQVCHNKQKYAQNMEFERCDNYLCGVLEMPLSLPGEIFDN